MPLSSYEELLTPVLKITDSQKDNTVEFEGMNMEAICVLLNFLDKRLDKVCQVKFICVLLSE